MMNSMRSMLIATDFSEEAESARRRAVSIAQETGLGGILAHVLPASLPPAAHLPATLQAQKGLAIAIEEMRRGGCRFESQLASGEIARELARAAQQHDMVVMGARGEDLLLDFSLGRTTTRLVRHSDRPVLIVKQPPDGPYRRVVAAVDFSAPSLAAAARGIQIAPRADFNLIHAFEVEFESMLRLAGTEDDTIHAYRRDAREKALAELDRFAARLALPRAQLWSAATLGYPPKVILDCAEQRDAQLIVIGKHAAGIVERYLVGSVALQVLEMAKCDVLVVPETVP